jgi:cell pole-organizing protein PopZ
MTKPHFSTEPSMEDILASIRKMISEERTGPRPIPDQIGRSPFGESSAERREPRVAGLEPVADAAPAPAERLAPSFSSLSDALKAAAASSIEQRRSLEEQIADMLENGGAAPRPASPPDSLAVFNANRPAPAPSPDAPAPRSALPERPAVERGAPERSMPERPSVARPASATPVAREMPRAPRPVSRPPEAPLNGAAHRRDAKPADTGIIVPLASEAPATHREEAAPRLTPAPASPSKAVEPGPDAEPKKPDDQRIIAMPSRLGAANGAGPHPVASPAATPSAMNGAPSAVNTMNGAKVSSLGPRSVSPGALASRAASILRETEADAPKDFDAPRDADPGARSSDAVTAKPGEAGARIRTTEGLADRLANVGKEPQAERNEAIKAELEARADQPNPADAAAPAIFPTIAATAAPAELDAATERAAAVAAEPAPARPAPSDALVDAVVALVHKEPDTLSVFTSGSAFIHGVSAQEPASKPGPNASRKLDRSAAELLRPMLRQWLSENMPRIVEEALRSELMSSQSPPEDSEET